MLERTIYRCLRYTNASLQVQDIAIRQACCNMMEYDEMLDVFNCGVIPSSKSTADVNVSPPSTDTENGTNPTRVNIGGTQMARICEATTPGKLLLLKRQITRPLLKSGPETLIGNPPSNIPTLGTILTGSAIQIQLRDSKVIHFS